MEASVLYTILSIVGGFISLALIINAYILKAIFSEVNAVKMGMASLITDKEGKELRLSNCEADIKDLYRIVNEVRREV